MTLSLHFLKCYKLQILFCSCCLNSCSPCMYAVQYFSLYISMSVFLVKSIPFFQTILPLYQDRFEPFQLGVCTFNEYSLFHHQDY